MDASEPRFYLKETGMDNVSTVRAYEFHEVSDEKPQTSDEPGISNSGGSSMNPLYSPVSSSPRAQTRRAFRT